MYGSSRRVVKCANGKGEHEDHESKKKREVTTEGLRANCTRAGEMSRSLVNGPDNVLKLQPQKLSLLLKLFLKLIEQSKSLKRCEPIHIDFLQPVHNLLGKRRKDGELDGLRLLAVAVVLQVLH